MLDYSDESTAHFKRLLLHCVIRPLVLRVAEGRKLLAYLFTLHEPFVADLHRAVKSQIPSCRKSQRVYGEVYLRVEGRRAARGRSGSRRCVQDLMWHALHAASSSMASAVRQVLAFPTTPSGSAASTRGLAVGAHPVARAQAQTRTRKNAATLFVEAFPLQDARCPPSTSTPPSKASSTTSPHPQGRLRPGPRRRVPARAACSRSTGR